MNISTESLARSSGKHPWWIVLAWLIVLAGAFVHDGHRSIQALPGTMGKGPTGVFI